MNILVTQLYPLWTFLSDRYALAPRPTSINRFGIVLNLISSELLLVAQGLIYSL